MWVGFLVLWLASACRFSSPAPTEKEKLAARVVISSLVDHREVVCGNHLSVAKVKCRFIDDKKSPSYQHFIYQDQDGKTLCPSDLQSTLLAIKKSAQAWGPKMGGVTNSDFENWSKIEKALVAAGLGADDLPLECAANDCRVWWDALQCQAL